MASLQEIKNRILSIQTTKKITNAMKLVAASKIKSMQEYMEKTKKYFFAVNDVFNETLKNVENGDLIFPKNTENRRVFIVVTSDLGLCGAFNNNVLKLFRKNFTKHDFAFVIGNKGFFALQSKKEGKRMFFYPNAGDKIDYNLCLQIGKEVIDLFESGKVKEVNIIYTKFLNSFFQQTTLQKILPFEIQVNQQQNQSVMEFEPSASKIIKNLLPLYLNTYVFEKLIESKVSEFSARRIAMENATDNAEEILEKLKINYNQIRQRSITQEILEVIGGSEG